MTCRGIRPLKLYWLCPISAFLVKNSSTNKSLIFLSALGSWNPEMCKSFFSFLVPQISQPSKIYYSWRHLCFPVSTFCAGEAGISARDCLFALWPGPSIFLTAMTTDGRTRSDCFCELAPSCIDGTYWEKEIDGIVCNQRTRESGRWIAAEWPRLPRLGLGLWWWWWVTCDGQVGRWIRRI